MIIPNEVYSGLSSIDLPIRATQIEQEKLFIINGSQDGRHGRYTCYARRGCEGKVINHRDPHNCKLSGGKSNLDSLTQECIRL
jgi:hypothetical protein